MRIIRTDKQKDNLAKYWWDLSKIMVADLVIAPFAKPEAVDLKIVGLGLCSGILSALFGHLVGWKGNQTMNPNTALLIVFGVVAGFAALGTILTLTDKNLKWKDRP